jgi:Zn-dependent membrane protease YugP
MCAMIYFDPMYLLFIAPAALLALWAQFRVKSTYAHASREPSRRGLSGAEAARRILDTNGLHHVNIECVQGFLSDHYDPRHEVLRLSPDVYEGRNLAAVGIAAHEAGHAIQKARHYAPLTIRNGLVPLAATGGQISMLLIMIGFVLMYASRMGMTVLLAGIALFAVTVVFQIVNLPVEFDASRRAKLALVEGGIVSPDELEPVNRVLSAAALTYVAATLTAVMQLLYFLWRAGLLGGRRD